MIFAACLSADRFECRAGMAGQSEILKMRVPTLAKVRPTRGQHKSCRGFFRDARLRYILPAWRQ